MTSCLGLYVDSNLIKYAKVTKDHDNYKVESFGVKFFEKVEDAIKQIIEETYSFKTPIAINLSEEMYEYFSMYSLLNKKDLQKAIKTEFEAYCTDKGYNPNVFESRYAVVDNRQDKEKLKIIHISANKIDLNRLTQQLEGYKLTGIFPIAMAITNLKEHEAEQNSIMVNIEDKTTITTIMDQKVYDIQTLEMGAQDFLAKINAKENSYAKSYEICKETTIYTSEGKDLTDEQTSHLEDIMPTLYEIVGQVKKIINESDDKINTVYISGTAALINNIDLYFEEYLENVKCEILKPDFIKVTPDINIKDYIEVNSAIAIGLMGLGTGVGGMNYKSTDALEQLKNLLKVDINPEKKGKEKKLAGNLFTNDLKQPLDNTEKMLLRIASTMFILFVVYSCFSGLLANQMDRKMQEAKESISSTNSQISLANSDNEKIKSKTNDYATRIKNLQEINDKLSERNKTKKAIPNLLSALMTGIPEGVQITSIQNTSNNHIEIIAQTTQYEQLGFFKAKIQNDNILTNVVSTAGQKDNNVITVKIEGDLP